MNNLKPFLPLKVRLFCSQFLLIIILLSCKGREAQEIKTTGDKREEINQIICTEVSCEGIYKGKEFINGSDVAHQFSNKMCRQVGEKLKELYENKKYSIVDLKNIHMSTYGMGTGEVFFHLRIPFKKVSDKCAAFTSFDHVGGWNHSPALNKRKKELSSLLLTNENLDISELKKTKEGLEEYWIQWKHKQVQKECSQ